MQSKELDWTQCMRLRGSQLKKELRQHKLIMLNDTRGSPTAIEREREQLLATETIRKTTNKRKPYRQQEAQATKASRSAYRQAEGRHRYHKRQARAEANCCCALSLNCLFPLHCEIFRSNDGHMFVTTGVTYRMFVSMMCVQ